MATVINKKEFIAYTAANSGLTKQRIGISLDIICKSICQALGRGEEVELTGFGKFGIKERAARTGRNPKTNEPIRIAPKIVPSFTPGKYMRDALDGGVK